MAAQPASGQGSKADFAYRTIQQRIVDGEYEPGQRLILDKIARELSISPLPVREAVRRLEAEGYVLFQRNVGAMVNSIDEQQYTDAMQVLAVLEGVATAESAPMLTESDLARARELNERMRELLSDPNPLGFTQLNREFHEALCLRCPNTHLRAMVEREWSRLDMIRRTTFSLVPGRAEDSVVEHDRLLRLIAAEASREEIERTARAHKLATLTAFQHRTEHPREPEAVE